MANPFNPWLGAFSAPLVFSDQAQLSATPIPAPTMQEAAAGVPSSPLVIGRSPKPQIKGPKIMPMPVVTPEIQASIDQIKAARDGVKDQQMSQNAALRAQLDEAMGRDFQTDLSPLAALVDQWSGSRISGAYQAPESVADRRKEIAGLQGALDKGQMGLAANDLSNLEADLARELGLEEQVYNRGYKQQRAETEDEFKRQEIQLQKDALDIQREKAEKAGASKPTEAQKAVDTAFGKDYADYVVAGGHAAAEKDLEQIGVAAARLAENPSLTGKDVGATPGWLLPYTNDNAAVLKSDVDQVVMSSLRRLLGSAFTQKEGERVLKATFDPSLPASANAERLTRLQTQMALAFEQKRRAAEYYEANGTTVGFKGYLPSVDSILAGVKDAPKEAVPKTSKMSPSEKEEYLKKLKAEAGE